MIGVEGWVSIGRSQANFHELVQLAERPRFKGSQCGLKEDSALVGDTKV